MDGLLGPLTLFLGGKCFLHVVLAENVHFALKIRNPIFLSLSKKHVFVPWRFKMDHKKSDFAYRNTNKELRWRIFFLPLSCLCLLCLLNLCVSWEVKQISNVVDDVSKWIIFVVLRSDRLRLIHCNFSSSIAKKIHLPIQFVVANIGCFPSQVLCNMSFPPFYEPLVIVQKSGKFPQNDCISI